MAENETPTAAADGEKAVAVDAESVKVAQDRSKKTDLRDGAPVARFLTGRTSDSDDPNRSWTVQSSTGYVDEASRPGQTFVKEQLPRPEEQIAAGIDPEAHAAPLPLVTRAPEDKALVPDDVLSGRV
jgi:hypothetical protein